MKPNDGDGKLRLRNYLPILWIGTHLIYCINHPF